MASLNDTTPDIINNDTNTTEPYFLNDSTTESLVLAGTMSMTVQDITVADESNDVTILASTNDRFLSFDTKTPTYYIKVPYDINAGISFSTGRASDSFNANDPTQTTLTNDDAWAMGTISINKSDAAAASAEYRLPAAEKQVTAATFQANDTSGEDRFAEWDVLLDVTLANDGAVSANASLDNDNAFTGLIQDDVQLAQHAYWPVNGASAPAVPQMGGDVLAATIAADDISSHFAANMRAVESDVNDLSNVVTDWTLTFNSISLDTSSNLSQYGQANNINDATLFVSGAKIVAADPHLYSVTVTTNVNSTDTVLVNDYVYGILEQN